jgi:hypothetical protein
MINAAKDIAKDISYLYKVFAFTDKAVQKIFQISSVQKKHFHFKVNFNQF